MPMPSVKHVIADDQAVTATAISENVLNLGGTPGTVPYQSNNLTRLISGGQPLPILIKVTTSFATLTSLTVSLESSAAAGLTSARVHWSSGAVAAADLVAGYQFSLREIPPVEPLQYLGLRFTVGGSNATAGTVFAALMYGFQTNQYP